MNTQKIKNQDTEAIELQNALDQEKENLREIKKAKAKAKEKIRQTLRMFMGEYSVDQKT